jgi:hypothetical protein
MEKEKKQMGFIGNILNSLSTNNLGYSGRKLTALFAILMGAYITYCKLPTEAYLHALYAWQILCMLCLGIVTVEQIIKFKNGGKDENTPSA